MALPRVRAPRRRELVWFDLTAGMPVAFGVLRARLGAGRAVRVALSVLRLGARRDPLAAVPRGTWPAPADAMTRHQLRAVVLLDDALRDELGLDVDERLAILGEVVGRAGARFVARHVPPVSRADWREASEAERTGFVERLAHRFFNARVELGSATAERLGFDVTACRFVELARAVGRPHLAPLFCEADAVRFDDPSSPIRLHRTGTIARGADRCDFRFEWR